MHANAKDHENKVAMMEYPLKLRRPWSGKKLVPISAPEQSRVLFSTTDADSEGDPLLVERRVGRGRIVLSAFALSQRELGPGAWPGFDGFFNGCLLRRPPRIFTMVRDDWDELSGSVRWDEPRSSPLDPELISGVRYFSRDAKVRADLFKREGIKIDDRNGLPVDDQRNTGILGLVTDGIDAIAGRPDLVGSGVAGWNDFNAPAEVARATLKKAAGISIPDASFVVYVLATYLFVLVPLNWGAFRLIGRVEWAWIAAPIITVICAYSVIHLAQLDIGFARARTEVALIELQGDYPRAHVTRYTALYTSLSSTYDLKFDDPSALVQPFPVVSRDRSGKDSDAITVHYRRDGREVSLTGFHVRSNVTKMLHSEQMLNVGGGFRLTSSASKSFASKSSASNSTAAGEAMVLVNESDLNLRDAMVIGPRGVARIGDFNAGDEVALSFSMPETTTAAIDVSTSDGAAAREADAKGLQVAMMMKLVANAGWSRRRDAALTSSKKQFQRSDLRLIGWSDQPLPGLDIQPVSKQKRTTNVIIATLKHARLAEPRRDTKPRSVRKKIQVDEPNDGDAVGED